MSKFNQKIVLFIESSEKPYDKPSKIGNLFMNRIAIDEDAAHEILKIYHLEDKFHSPTPMVTVEDVFYMFTDEEGLDLIIYGIKS